LTLEEPGRKNAMTPELGDALKAKVAELKGHTDLRAVVLHGADGTFSGGGDLAMLERLRGVSKDESREFMRSFYARYLSVLELEVPTVAVVEALKSLAQPCRSTEEIAHVAAISANNDRSIGDLIARAIDRVGRDGAVSIEDGSGLDSLLEVTEGLQFDRGFLSPYFVNDGERHSARLDEAAVLVVDGRLTTLKELLPVLEDVVKERRPLLVIAEDIVDEALAALVINTVQGTLRACAVKAPGFGDQRRALLQDIAVLTGAQLVSAERGLPLHQTRLSHLGRVRKVEVTRSDTTLVGGAGSAEAIAERVSSLKAERGRV
jgi:chaperonin GroEL